MARHEGNFRDGTEAPLSLAELLSLLGSGVIPDERSRGDAIACYLSGGDGWKDAVKKLGGTFAGAAEMKERKAD